MNSPKFFSERIIKSIIFALAITLACSFVFLLGCGSKNESVILKHSLNQDIIAAGSQIYEGDTSFTDIKAELENFKSYSDEFFAVWMENKNTSYPMIENFNNCSILEEKINTSRLLEDKYLEFKSSIENIRPPAIAVPASRSAIEAVSLRILFFEKFSESASIDELKDIEDQAYIAEIELWDEFDRIYKYFDEEISKLGIEDDYKFIVLK
ncbi:MAG: hypothetical protein ACYCXK_01520 [Candidatus Humimicrobiaceae bacterium]